MRAFWFSAGIFGSALIAGSFVAVRGTSAASLPPAPVAKVLIVMDERPQMEVLARYFREKGKIESQIVDQKTMPENWSEFAAVIGYIHGKLEEKTELTLIDYTRNGGRFIGLHHMISSGKSKNKYYFDFLGVRMDDIESSREPAVPGGHYAWREGIQQTVVNVSPRQYITSNGVSWPGKAMFVPDGASSGGAEYPAMNLEDSEAYMNVKFTDGKDKLILLGYKYLDDRNQILHQQLTEGWIKPSGKGWIIYLQPGHSVHEYRNPAIAQMVLNAITWKPKA